MTGRPAADPRLEARRADLVRVAAELMLKHGYRNVGVNDIVGGLGLSRGTFYNYFDNRRDILDAVVDSLAYEITERVLADESPTAAQTLDDFLVQLTRIQKRMLELITDRPELVPFVAFEAASIDVDLVQRIISSHFDLVGITGEYLRHGVETGFLRADLDIDVAADLLMTVVATGATEALGAFGGDWETQCAAALAAVIDFVRHGFGAQ